MNWLLVLCRVSHGFQPSRQDAGHRQISQTAKSVLELKRFWVWMRKVADIPVVPIDDLRQTFASLLVSGGASLEMIGEPFSHTQVGITQRYAHLIESSLRASDNVVGKMLRSRLKEVDE